MIKPALGELLDGVATSLEELVAPDVPDGPARRQVEAAIRILRRAAVAAERMGPYLYADNRDIEETLRHCLPTLARAAARGPDASLAAVCERLRAAVEPPAGYGEAYPSLATLSERNDELQALLVGVREALAVPSGLETAERQEMLSALRALFRRMLARQLELAPSSPKRP